jgi:hypothetical protein
MRTKIQEQTIYIEKLKANYKSTILDYTSTHIKINAPCVATYHMDYCKVPDL